MAHTEVPGNSFLELAQATVDDSYLADAQRGADHIAATWRLPVFITAIGAL